MTSSTAERPTIGALVSVRGQQWVVSDVEPAARATVVALQSVDRLGDTLEVVGDVEPGRRVLPAGSLPDVAPDGFDPPERLAAFLDAVRWTAVTSADVKTLQSPFRSGVATEDYQLEPVVRAVDAPRVNLLLADDVGLGKTIEAGLVAQELRLRERSRRLAPHFTHRLFLSATPHNGYPASFTALLEILDDQRFARGVTPDPAAVRDTVVRRLKRDIVDADGTPRSWRGAPPDGRPATRSIPPRSRRFSTGCWSSTTSATPRK